MRLRRLSSVSPGVVAATVTLADGVTVDVQFTTARAGGITVANPSPADLFDMEPMSAEDTRTIVAAVLAFDRAARG